ncbi:trypsin-1-like isoform X2 [Planococcus citri]|uniref:trypsin-1-like isoform X2 n=1 Tax=Planococcus citri TaxID=170843 RepID=UPI0031F8B454
MRFLIDLEFACIRNSLSNTQPSSARNWFLVEKKTFSSVQCKTASGLIKMSLSSIKFACVTVAGTWCIVFLHNLSITNAGVLTWAGDKLKNTFSTTTPHTSLSERATLCECSCGIANEDTRIVGGKPSEPNEFPWMVRLSYFNRFYCGGTLINDRYVLTAAHCVKGFLWFMIKVTLGEHDRCNSTAKPETRFVLRVFAGNFSFFNFDNDIALLRLNDRVPMTDTIKPICLPKSDEDTYEGKVAKLSGWGTLEEGGKPACILRMVDVPVISNEKCVSRYPTGMVTDNMMCAGYDEGKKDSCQGDSGGPLMTARDDKRYELIGVVSWGNGCARPKYPGVYTRVTKYLSWIEKNANDGCYCGG